MWFRIHTTLVHNPKAQSLPDRLFKSWINLLCLAKEGDGVIPGVLQIAFHLRIKVLQAEQLMDDLEGRGFMARNPDGTFQPNDWNEHQYKSDVSTERVKAFRETQKKRFMERPCNKSETPPDTETETEQKEKASPKSGAATAHGSRFTLTQIPDEFTRYAIDVIGWTTDQTLSVFEDFRLYWIAQPGAKGRKSDWYATWQGWCRRERQKARSPTLFAQQPRKLNFMESVEKVMGERIARGEAPL